MARIDYIFFNYCNRCELSFPKDLIRCPRCHQRLRTRAHNVKRSRRQKFLKKSN